MAKSRNQHLQALLDCGLIPVIRAGGRDEAVEIAGVLVEAGVPVVEIAFTVPGALQAIEAVADRFGERVLAGAGTVLDRETARLAILAGARFIVSPHLDRGIVETTHRYGGVAIPGVLTPTEVVRALGWGAGLIKIFPCDAVGGPAYLQALKAPLPQARLVPTGGVTAETAAAYLRAGADALGVGGGLVGEAQRRQKDWRAVRANAAKLLAAIAAHRAGNSPQS